VILHDLVVKGVLPVVQEIGLLAEVFFLVSEV
jgi:hypothetical protein